MEGATTPLNMDEDNSISLEPLSTEVNQFVTDMIRYYIRYLLYLSLCKLAVSHWFKGSPRKTKEAKAETQEARSPKPERTNNKILP